MVGLEWDDALDPAGRQLLLSAVFRKVQQYNIQIEIGPSGNLTQFHETRVWLNPVFASILHISKGTSVRVFVYVCVWV